jgi:hypothetical protein
LSSVTRPKKEKEKEKGGVNEKYIATDLPGGKGQSNFAAHSFDPVASGVAGNRKT